MSTSMPYKRRPIEVTPDQVAYLRHAEAGSLLVWIEASNEVQVCPPTGRFGEHRMIIAAQDALDGLTEFRKEEGWPVGDADLAEDLTDIANDWLSGWSRVRVLTAMLTPIRLRLDGEGIYPADSVHLHGWGPGPDLPRVTETYARPGGNASVRVTVPLGYTEPVRFHSHGVNAPVSEHTMLFDYLGMRPKEIEAKVAATVIAHLDLH